MAYPLTEYDGTSKTMDWAKIPSLEAPVSKGETRWVEPERLFDQLQEALRIVPPLPGEEAMYATFGALLDAASKDATVKGRDHGPAVETAVLTGRLGSTSPSRAMRHRPC